MRGWFDLRELDSSAERRAVWLIDEAKQHGSLISIAVQQLLVNFDGCSRPDRRDFCWMGRILPMVTKVWPRFRVLILNDNIVYTGALPSDASDPNDTLARKYCRDVRALRWRRRQVDVMNAWPTKFQKDFFRLIRLACVMASTCRLYLTQIQ